MNIAIIEAHIEDSHALSQIISQYLAAAYPHVKFNITVFESSRVFFNCFKKGKYQIVIIGITKRYDITAARNIFKIDRSACIIFTSDSLKYFSDCFSVQPIYYILKPVLTRIDKIREAIDFSLERLSLQDKSMSVVSFGQTVSILHMDIMYIECVLERTYMHLTDGCVLELSGRISEYIKKLAGDSRFIEVFRSIVVNVAYVKKISSDTLMLINGEVLPVSRRKKTAVLNRWNNHNLSAKITKRSDI